ncbi:hypothetical protein [Marinibactrum halimedae]|uniref:Tetratricopeptide repeat protein n=1 Tax=Marinibactrum halimedae TaxID=1444977 RepID=A0AA37TDW1_9GAMM|nr:hypothetical protein [Marinibactrum halimedae]MCD9460864.1 hypothetical protein [Marinibactrum halimedae]GLS27357.1 hypothetical protein GCM10007877_30760 [Marinibactrum halimedae]
MVNKEKVNTVDINTLQSVLKNGKTRKARQTIKKILKKPLDENTAASLTRLCIENALGEETILAFSQILKLNPTYAQEVIAIQQTPPFNTDPQLALQLMRVAIEAQPNNVSVQLKLVDVLLLNGILDESEQRLLPLVNTQHAVEALARLSETYYRANRLHEALAASQLSTELEPNNDALYKNLGITQVALGRFTDAAKSHHKAISLNPDNYYSHINLSQLALMIGEFKLGWAENEWRFKDKTITQLNFPCPLWRGEPLNGKSIILWGDQGLGDHIMYSRLISNVLEQGASITLLIDHRLTPLYQRSFKSVNVVALSQTNVALISSQTHDFHLSLGSLPQYFIHSFEDIQPCKPFLLCHETQFEKFKNGLPKKAASITHIGFSWRGGSFGTRKQSRTIPLAMWEALFNREDLQFYNLQYDSSPEEKAILDSKGVITPSFDVRNDIEALSAFMCAIDCLLSADNSTVHLSGALGVNTFVLLPASAEWRWFTDPDQSLWYESVSLIRQPPDSNWEQPMRTAEKKIEALINSANEPTP